MIYDLSWMSPKREPGTQNDCGRCALVNADPYKGANSQSADLVFTKLRCVHQRVGMARSHAYVSTPFWNGDGGAASLRSTNEYLSRPGNQPTWIIEDWPDAMVADVVESRRLMGYIVRGKGKVHGNYSGPFGKHFSFRWKLAFSRPGAPTYGTFPEGWDRETDAEVVDERVRAPIRARRSITQQEYRHPDKPDHLESTPKEWARWLAVVALPGDLVADGMEGQGTVMLAAQALGLHWSGSDADLRCVKATNLRLRKAHERATADSLLTAADPPSSRYADARR